MSLQTFYLTSRTLAEKCPGLHNAFNFQHQNQLRTLKREFGFRFVQTLFKFHTEFEEVVVLKMQIKRKPKKIQDL